MYEEKCTYVQQNPVSSKIKKNKKEKNQHVICLNGSDNIVRFNAFYDLMTIITELTALGYKVSGSGNSNT